jgi:hypothetical protein
MIVMLFTMLSINLLGDFLRTGHVTGLLLLAGEALVVILTVVRRKAMYVDRSIAAGVLTLLSVAGPPMLRASDVTPLVPDVATAMVSAIGLAWSWSGRWPRRSGWCRPPRRRRARVAQSCGIGLYGYLIRTRQHHRRPDSVERKLVSDRRHGADPARADGSAC